MTWFKFKKKIFGLLDPNTQGSDGGESQTKFRRIRMHNRRRNKLAKLSRRRNRGD